ncbi:MAG: hypothetical protein HY423_15990 [Candidatus Lambdaproteobacteria bacterium]|nr:hypothetical protein [Candidatus Lambdaproteobacteria bacterium]
MVETMIAARAEALRVTWRLALIGVGMAVTFVALLMIANLVPNDRIVEHLQMARTEFGRNYMASPIPGGTYGMRGECTWLSAGIAPDDDPSLLSRAVRARGIAAPQQCRWLRWWLHGGRFIGRDYFRYWHGYQIVTRPILWLSGYPLLQAANLVAVLGLFAGLVWAVARRLDLRTAGCIVAAALLLRFDNPLFTVNHGVSWMIALGAGLVVLNWKAAYAARFELFFVTGGVTVYFDLLTNPLATFMLPALLLLLRRKRLGEYPVDRQLWDIGLCGMAWAGRYFGLWLVKFILAVAVIGHGALDNIVAQAALRAGGETPFGAPHLLLATGRNLARILNPPWRAMVVGTCLAVVLVRHCRFSRWRRIPELAGYGALMLLPVVWYEVFANHSAIYAGLTHRYLLVPLTLLFLSATSPPIRSPAAQSSGAAPAAPVLG